MSGHIRRRGENSWELKFDTGRDARGARGVRYMSFKGTKRAAAARLTELLGESARGTLVDASKETLRDFLSRWDRDWAVSNVSPKTMERYRQLIANQIVKHLGNMPVQKIKPAHLNTLYATLLRAQAALRAKHWPRRPLDTVTGYCAEPSDTQRGGASSPRTRPRWSTRHG
jgi:hypothetical protein